MGTVTGWVLGRVVGLVISMLANCLYDFAIVVLALNLPKLLIMVFTASGGAATIVSGFLLLFGQIHTAALPYGFAAAAIRASWIWSLVVMVLAVVGFMT